LGPVGSAQRESFLTKLVKRVVQWLVPDDPGTCEAPAVPEPAAPAIKAVDGTIYKPGDEVDVDGLVIYATGSFTKDGQLHVQDSLYEWLSQQKGALTPTRDRKSYSVNIYLFSI
jgi:hypothetical protein